MRKTAEEGETAPDSTRVREQTEVTTKRRRHFLTLADAEAIASLCAKRASESEACAVLGISRSTWGHWKAKPKNAEKFEGVLSRIRGEKIKAHLDNIEEFSKKDWRASEAYLEKVMPDRYSNRALIETSPPAVQVNVSLFADRAALVYGGQAGQPAAIGQPGEVKLLAETTEQK